jgi:Ran GTPase-activating protein (RanGAP) involved in mRNA processing and transport
MASEENESNDKENKLNENINDPKFKEVVKNKLAAIHVSEYSNAIIPKVRHTNHSSEPEESIKVQLENAETATTFERIISDKLNAYALNQIEYLDFSGHRINNKAIQALVECRHLINLKILSLKENKLGSLGAILLAHSQYFKSMRSLNISDTMLTVKGVVELVESNFFPKLVNLDASYNAIGDKGVKTLVKSPMVRRLKKLDLSGTLISDVGATILANSHFPELKSLNISNNHICEDGAKALAYSLLSRFKNLKALKLSNRSKDSKYLYFSKKTEEALKHRFSNIDIDFSES